MTKANTNKIFIVVILMGILPRLRHYLAGLSLWNDEAALAINLIERDWVGMLAPFDNGQVLPIGLALLEKCMISLFGISELSLRFIPFVAAIAGLFLCYRFLEEAAGKAVALLCTAQLAFTKEAIYYAYDVKQYSTDFFLAIAILWFGWRVIESNRQKSLLLLFIIFGALTVWLSFPAAFMLFGAGTVILIIGVREKDWQFFSLAFFGCISWAALFLVHIKALSSHLSNNPLLNMWEHYFLPLFPSQWHRIGPFLAELPRIFRDPLWTGIPLLSLIFFILGCVVLWKKQKALLGLVVLPLIANLIASGFYTYPFGGRVLQYGVVILFIPIAYFFAWAWGQAGENRKWAKVLIVIFVAVNLAEPSVHVVKHLVFPNEFEELGPVAEFVQDNMEEFDVVYIFGGSKYPWYYYRHRLDFYPKNEIVGKVIIHAPHDRVIPDLRQEANSLKDHKRFWAVFAHAKFFNGLDNESIMLQEITAFAEKTKSIHRTGASAYLFQTPSQEKK